MRNGAKTNQTIRIIIVDSRQSDIDLYKTYIEETPKFELLYQTHSGKDAQLACIDLQPDIIIISRNIRDVVDTDLLKMVLKDCPTSCVIMVSTSQDNDWITKIMQIGGRFFLGKPLVKTLFHEAVHSAYEWSQNLKRLHEQG
ncbi:MAG: hypothetical protein Phog2KO_26750 [Phototrophicaceae bacterium]